MRKAGRDRGSRALRVRSLDLSGVDACARHPCSRVGAQNAPVAPGLQTLFDEARVKLIGILLIIFGTLMLVYGGIRYNRQESVLEIGSVQVTAERHHEILIPPIIGIVTIVGGIVLVVADVRTRA